MARGTVSVKTTLMVGIAVALLAWQTSARAQAVTPSLLLSSNQTVFGPGATLDVTLGLASTGSTGAMDLHFGIILPDGDSVVFFENGGTSTGSGRVSDLRSLRPIVSGLAVGAGTSVAIPSFFHYVWQGFEPLGRYRFYFVALRAGALGNGRIDGGELLALQTAEVEHRAPSSVTVDASHATSALVPIAGGAVTATAADGTTFRLDVPPGALGRETTITLTPVTEMTGVPGQFQGIRAVRAEPEGLTFGVPARLTIHPPAAAGGPAVVGFSTTSTGAGIDLNPAVRLPNGDLVLANVSHFSVLGTGVPATLAELGLGTSGAAFFVQVVTAVEAGDRALAEALLGQWFDTLVSPLLTAGRSDRIALLEAMREFFMWDSARVSAAHLLGVQNGSFSATRSTRGKTDINTGLVAGFAGLNADCLTTSSLAAAENVLRLRALGDAYYERLRYAVGFAPQMEVPFFGPVNLGLPEVVAGLCVRVTIGTATFPPPVAGVTAPVAVQAGLRFTNGAVTVTPPLQVRVDAFSATPSQRVGTTDATGRFTANFTPTSTGTTLDIRATLIDSQVPYLTDATLTDTRRLTQAGAVVVSPPQTTILAGQSRQFSAVVEGVTNQTVTWSVSGGGTISATGLFTSNGNAGVFFVTATSQADPNSVGIAQVTVTGASGPASVQIFTDLESSPNLITITVQRGPGLDQSVVLPFSQVANVSATVRGMLSGATSLSLVAVLLDQPIVMTLDLTGLVVEGDVQASVRPRQACSTSNQVDGVAELRLGQVQGRTTLNTCGGGVDLSATSLGNTIVSATRGTVALFAQSAAAVEAACANGQIDVAIADVALGHLRQSTQCNMGISSQFHSVLRIANNTTSTLGTLQLAPGAALEIESNTGTSFQISGGNLGGLPGERSLFINRNSGLSLSAIAIGNIGGDAIIENNVGFTDAAANAFLDSRTVGGSRSVMFNRP